MNAEKTLLRVNAALLHLRDNATENVFNILELLKEDAELEIYRNAAKSAGRLDRFKACGRVLKIAMSDARPALRGSWTVDGLQYICDSFRLVCLREPLDLPTIPDDVQPIDAARILDPAKKNNGTALDLPTVADLRAYIKMEKARLKASGDKNSPVWDFGDDLPSVNAAFLLDILEIFPDASATASSRSPKLNSIYFDSADGCGILLPVRKNNRFQIPAHNGRVIFYVPVIRSGHIVPRFTQYRPQCPLMPPQRATDSRGTDIPPMPLSPAQRAKISPSRLWRGALYIATGQILGFLY